MNVIPLAKNKVPKPTLADRLQKIGDFFESSAVFGVMFFLLMILLLMLGFSTVALIWFAILERFM